MRTVLHLASRLRQISLVALVMTSLTLLASNEALAEGWVLETADGSANNVGAFSSIAIDASGAPCVSYYDGTAGDLKYARRSAGAWTIETAEGSMNDVGVSCSLVLNASGDPHISYIDWTTKNLKYAWKSGGVWMREIAESNMSSTQTSLALDASGNPRVSYIEVSGPYSVLKYARKLASTWVVEAVIVTNASTYYPSLTLDASGNPHISCSNYATLFSGLAYARKSGNSWQVEIVDGSSSYLTSIALDASGNPHIGYQGGSGQLKYARRSGAIWLIETVDAADFTGYGASLKLDALGRPNVSYALQDISNGDLKYARKSGGVWTIQTPDGSANRVGYRTSLALEAQGSLHISYDDATTGDLRYARAKLVAIREGDGKITWGPVTSWGEFGTPTILVSPNPSHGPVSIFWRMPVEGASELAAFDVSGRKIRTLVSGALAEPTSVSWDGRDDSGAVVAPGTYFLRLTSSHGDQATERVTIVR